MASPACHLLSPLSRISPDLPRRPHPSRHSPLPFPASQPDPLPCSNNPQSFALSPSPSAATSPLQRKVFDDAVCLRSVLDQELESRDNSTESSTSSYFMSSNSDDDEDDTGSSSGSSLSELSSPAEGPLDNLTSLCSALPIKRGLSRYFSGKSQSFSSLGRVSSVAELAKPESPYAKRRRTGMVSDLLHKHHSYPPRCASSAGILKRSAVSSRHKILRCMPQLEDSLLEGHATSRPPKSFSAPEF